MRKVVVAWTKQIEQQAKQVNAKALPVTNDGKKKLVIVAFGPDAKERVASILEKCKAIEEGTPGQASNRVE